MAEVTASLSSGFATTDMVLNVGPQHPATHGVLRLRLTLDGERIIECEPIIGYMHRGVEKLFEVRDYRQIIVLANRHDWLSAFSSELGVVLAMEEISGGRMHYMFNRVGGLKEDMPAGWTGRVAAAVEAVRTRLPQIEDLILGNEIFQARTRGVGKLSADLIHAYGVSGPVARASGVDFDLRRDEPYLAYGELGSSLRVVSDDAGDCFARFAVLFEQVKVSLDIADECLERLAGLGQGPVNVRLPKILKAPEGSIYVWTENPLGLNGYYLVSRGEKTPWRLKLRSASFNNVAVLPEVLKGHVVADMVAILGSMFFVVGDVDK